MFEIYSPELYSAEPEYLLALNSCLTNDPGVSGAARDGGEQAEIPLTCRTHRLPNWKNPPARRARRCRCPRRCPALSSRKCGGRPDSGCGHETLPARRLGIVWVIAQMYEQRLAVLEAGAGGDRRSRAAAGDRELCGRVTFIYPSADEKSVRPKSGWNLKIPGYF